MLGDSNFAPIRPSSGLVHSGTPNIPRNESCDSTRVPAHQGMNNEPSDSTTGRRPAFGDASSSMDISPAFSPAPPWTGIPSEDDQRLHSVGVAALAAVSQYPYPLNEESDSFLVSEVVGAMTSSARPAFRHPQSMGLDTDWDSSETDHHGGVIVNDLIERTATWEHIATIENRNGHDNMQKDMMMDYDPPFVDYASSPSSGSDDDLEDLLKFYPGEEAYLRQRKETRSPVASMRDVNLDEFYDHVTYDDPEVDAPQPPENTTPTGGSFGRGSTGGHRNPSCVDHSHNHFRTKPHN
ncbi:hypothetical protein N7494_004856 [Penicillium frequentans]|uniref:Uncharacterized protein n=1 Tax=Penicillium frequentans TaxID=3151616 RepID=A0AAD6D3G4_9EURO|nr:hypothetical protein N7494_004856 [Penicillium glabrum]